jgi:hypothetical protein
MDDFTSECRPDLITPPGRASNVEPGDRQAGGSAGRGSPRGLAPPPPYYRREAYAARARTVPWKVSGRTLARRGVSDGIAHWGATFVVEGRAA